MTLLRFSAREPAVDDRAVGRWIIAVGGARGNLIQPVACAPGSERLHHPREQSAVWRHGSFVRGVMAGAGSARECVLHHPTPALLCGTAAVVGFLHTILGPDHYVPFIAMSRVGGWSVSKTLLVTWLCGIGHVISSIALGALGIAGVMSLVGLDAVERVRGDFAGWLLLGFGLAYMAWGIRRAIRNRPHTHWHTHGDGVAHTHPHTHTHEHVHVHADDANTRAMTPWILFTIFVFGPCEPLIPLLMLPAAERGLVEVAIVTLVFAAVTLTTMTAMVMLGRLGVARLSTPGLARYTHALAGFAVAICGGAVQFGL